MKGLESRSIEGLTAIITGAASGMGKATAHLFAASGAHVVLTDIKQEACAQTAKEISNALGGGSILPLAFDVSDKSQHQKIVETTITKFGGIDIIVNNAGLSTFLPFTDENYDRAWQTSLDIMLNAQQWLIQAALPHLKKSKSPRIVNISSSEGLGATLGNSAYSVAKHGVVGLTRALAVEFGRDGITCNCICPGPVETGITKDIPDEHKTIYAKRRTALRRYGKPEEVAHMTLSLVLPAASFITGAIIPVDGGLMVRNA
jgi:3-oxoacyl-[acyl-carrier protein] reductase